MKDILGQEIRVGEFVVYAVSAMAADLNIGKLMKISSGGRNNYFHILGCDENYEWEKNENNEYIKISLGYKLRLKEGRVLGSKRVLVIDQSMVCNEIKELYK